jgi:hypothetical protein
MISSGLGEVLRCELRRISERRRLLSIVNRDDRVIRQKCIQVLRQIYGSVITVKWRTFAGERW